MEEAITSPSEHSSVDQLPPHTFPPSHPILELGSVFSPQARRFAFRLTPEERRGSSEAVFLLILRRDFPLVREASYWWIAVTSPVRHPLHIEEHRMFFSYTISSRRSSSSLRSFKFSERQSSTEEMSLSDSKRFLSRLFCAEIRFRIFRASRRSVALLACSSSSSIEGRLCLVL